jgi:hypothetical protein
MRHTTTIAETLPLASCPDVLTEVCRTGARQMLAQAVEVEVAAYLDSRCELRDEAGRQQVVRNGRLPRRTILRSIPRRPLAWRRIERPCRPSMTSRPSIGFICGRPTRSNRRSPRCDCERARRREAAHARRV